MLQSQTSHIINQTEFHTFLREHSMLNEARGLVTQWKIQSDDFFDFEFDFDFQAKVISSTSYPTNLKITHNFVQISYLTDSMQMRSW